MEKPQAQKIVSDLFSNAFNKENYQTFLQQLLNEITPGSRGGKQYSGNLVPDAFRDHINQYWCLGKYVDPDGEEIDLQVVEVKTLSKLERARSSLRNFAVNRLKQFEKEAGLFAFYAKDDQGADWRFSFVKIEHEAVQDAKGKVKLKQELTPAKRYSFLVGEHENSHTAAKQLLPLLQMDYANPTLAEIESAFSIEKVTDEFFEQYKQLFLKLGEHLKQQPYFKKIKDDNEKDQNVSRFAKKLLGQIVFLYFLQKKGWLGVPKQDKWGKGGRKFMRTRFTQTAEQGKNYYHDFLQYLFYEALASERKNQTDPGYYKPFDCRIPFLNGGLFEADYDWQKEHIDIPNELFHNHEKQKNGDVGTGILNVFDRYNFTIKEDEPLEKEVAVDPEMLGKIFERMIPVTERKKDGAFYTPREIVHYMCQESLIHYLDNTLNTYAETVEDNAVNQSDLFSTTKAREKNQQENIRVAKSDIETLIRMGHLALENDNRVLNKGKETDSYKFKLPESIRKHANTIDEALATIKVCDPAIGSGAFPVGLLHEIVNTRLALAPHSGNKKGAYELKHHSIAESIYGVDINSSAIDIARLRLWLSLIVDEDDYGNIEALPNLDYKIVCGNSLVGFPENWCSPAFDKIETLKDQFFAETDHKEKAKLKSKIDAEIQKRLSDSKKIFGWQVDFDFRLMFSEVWHHKDGFDVVIGNPPYVQIQNFSGQQIQKDWELQKYESFAKTGDIYCLFYEKGYRLLKDKGALAYITSNKWMRAAYGEKLRRFFSERTQPLNLIDFSSFQVFETATVDTNVLLFEKSKPYKSVQACLISPAFTRATSLDVFVEKNNIELDELSSDSWVISDKRHYEIKKRIEQVGTPLKQWDIAIYRGILTGFNEAFIIDGKKKDELIAADPKSAEFLKPFLNGRDLKRYKVNFADAWLIFVPWHFPLHKDPSINGASIVAEKAFQKTYPTLYKYLQGFQESLSNRNQSETGKRYEWYALQRCAASYYEEFSNQKIVWGNLALSAQFSLAEPGFFVNAPSNLITGPHLFYLLSLLNSEVGDYFIRTLGVTRNGGYFEYKPMFVENLPVPKLDQYKRKPFEALANYVLCAIKHEKKLQSSYFEQLIDALVYEIYFPNELKAANKQILQHVGELTPISDEMTDEEKLAIIQKEFDRLYDPRHPVRNIIETLDSVAVVRTIRESLQRK